LSSWNGQPAEKRESKQDWTNAIDGPGVFFAVLLAAAAWKFWVASSLGLIYDECYYWLWSLHPQLGYYDHPPLVAWSIAAGSALFGHSEFAVRFFPVLSGMVLALAGRSLAASLYGNAAGNRAGIFLLLAPIFAGNAFLSTPDTLLAPAFAVAMLCAWKGIQPGASWIWWPGAGLASGVGALSKYTMVLFFGGLAILWLASPGRRLRIFLGTLSAGLVALAIFSPVIIWNAQNDWASFGFQLRHGFRNQQQSFVNFDKLGNYIAYLVVIASPVLGLLCFRSATRRLRDPRFLFPAAFFWAVVAFFAISAAKAKIEANWPMCAFIGGLVLVAGNWDRFGPAWRKWALGVLVAGDLVAAFGISLAAMPPHSALSPRNFLPPPPETQSSAGLAGLIQKQLGDLRLKLGEILETRQTAASINKGFQSSGAEFVCAGNYQLAAITAFYAPELKDLVWLPRDGPKRLRWIDHQPWIGKTALVVSWNKDPKVELGFFQSHEGLGKIHVPGTHPVFVYLGKSYSPPKPGAP
jgi:hypothetical protein